MITHVSRQDALEIVAYGFLIDESESAGRPQNTYIQVFHSAHDVRTAMSCAYPDVQVLICEASSSEVSPLNLAAALHKDTPQRDIYLQRTDPSGLFVSRVEAAGGRGVISEHEAKELLGALKKRSEYTYEPDFAPFEKLSFGYEEDVPFEAEAYTYPEVLSDGAALLDNALSGCESDTWASSVADPFDEIPSESTCPSSASSYEASSGLASSVDALELSWLEQVLALDELDECASDVTAALVERKPLEIPHTNIEAQVSEAPEVRESAERGKQAVVAAFISGRGGVGKSSLAVLAAVQLRQLGVRVALLDMDLQFGDLSVLLGDEPGNTVVRLSLEDICAGKAIPAQNQSSLLLIEPPHNPELAEDLIQQVPGVLALLKSQRDIVLVNTSCLWNEAQAVLACSVDKLVVCMDQRATSVSAARQVVDLCVRLQIPSTKMHYLLNRCSRNALITDIDASLAMHGAPIVSIADGGADVDELLSLGCPLELLSAKAQLRQSVQKLGTELLAEPGVDPGVEGVST